MDLEKLIEKIALLEQKIDEIHQHVVPKKKEPKNATVDPTVDEKIEDIYLLYKNRINKRSRLIDKAKKKVKARLKEYSVDDLKSAINKFSQDDWWMKNNAHRGVAWFFHSEERIEQFLNLTPQKEKKAYELFYDNQPCKLFDSKLKIYTPWAGSWLDWNKNHPEYDKFTLKENNTVIENGKNAYITYLEKIHKN